MAAKKEAGMPPDLELGGTWTIELAALNPTTGAAVAGVNVGQVVIALLNTGEAPIADLAFGPWRLVPGPGT